MKEILKDLNEAQRMAVEHYKGPSLVVAGAGSGKTRVLTYRIAHLLQKGVMPHRILALTFTNKAAREMKERIAELVSYNLARQLWMGTFHSLFARILRREAKVIGYPADFVIYDTIDSRNLVKQIIKDLKLDDKLYKPAEVFGRISYAKNNLITPDVYMNSNEIRTKDMATRRPRMGEIYLHYARRCKKFGAMDFDDLLLQINLLFRDHPEVLDKYRKTFDFVLVDEYQDTNYSQYLILKGLSSGHRNICVVGDDAQSIYSFRGARIENILNFRKDYSDYRLFKLERNYRSTQMIVKAANSVISKNKDQIEKTLYSKQEDGEKVKVVRLQDDREEGFFVARSISELRFNEHLEYKNFAVLYRTNAQSRIFEESLRKMNIPYKVYGSLSFYQRKEIKDLLAYFRFVVNSSDDESLKRIINYPLRGIGKTTVEKLAAYAEKLDTPIWNILVHLDQSNPGLNQGTVNKLNKFTSMIKEFMRDVPRMEAFDIAYTIATRSGIMDDLKTEKTPEAVSRYENIEELLNGIKDYTDNMDNEGEVTLATFLQDVTLMTDADNENKEDINKVSIMTVHASKGLEFKHVFIAGMEEELFPSAMSTGEMKGLEEERRLFYVALTRSGKSATITYASSRYRWGLLTYTTPSRFIKEINREFVDLPHDFYPVIPQVNEEMETPRTARNDSHPFPGLQKRRRETVGSKKLLKMESAAQSIGVSAGGENIETGMKVEHARFGIGVVEQIEGAPPNIKATVHFPIGRKQLLLKFAKLRIIQ
ncbi:MAG: UvrD-helicase domain-containing protein [Bacteroidales bacterium]|nr:UvrD-helicase domain-containing protein [Bacteroidales bacterium]